MLECLELGNSSWSEICFGVYFVISFRNPISDGFLIATKLRMLKLNEEVLNGLKAAEIDTSGFEKEWRERFEVVQDSVFSSKEFCRLVWVFARVPCLLLALAIYLGFTSPHMGWFAVPCILYIGFAKYHLSSECEAKRQHFTGIIEGRLKEKKEALKNTAQMGIDYAKHDAEIN